MEKIVRRLKVNNELGLHARPAATIVKLLQDSSSKVCFTYKRETIDARSIMSILMMAIKKDSWVTVTIEGEDAKKVLMAISKVFKGEL